MNKFDKEAIELASGFCKENGHKLLLISKFGSHLYGTNTEKSDHDYKGLYLPNINDMLCGEFVKSKTFKIDDTRKNNDNDLDLELFSLQYFLARQ